MKGQRGKTDKSILFKLTWIQAVDTFTYAQILFQVNLQRPEEK